MEHFKKGGYRALIWAKQNEEGSWKDNSDPLSFQELLFRAQCFEGGSRSAKKESLIAGGCRGEEMRTHRRKKESFMAENSLRNDGASDKWRFILKFVFLYSMIFIHFNSIIINHQINKK